jgi:hypothetical protein
VGWIELSEASRRYLIPLGPGTTSDLACPGDRE